MNNNNNITKTNMQDVMSNQGLIMHEKQSKLEFLKSLHTLQMQLSGVGKNLTGFGYKYQDFNEIIREIKQVIKSNNLDIDFVQCPTIKSFDGNIVNVIETTFYSTKTGYRESFDTPIYTEELKSIEWKSKNTFPQLVGSCITYFKRYALVAYLSIESEVDTDANTLGTRQDATEEQSKGVEIPPVDVKSNNLTNDKVEKDVKSNNPVSVNKANSIKFSCYRSLLIAARRMHKYLVNKPFDSIAQINAYLNAIKLGDDSSLLEYFNMHKALGNVNYWIELIREYIFKNNHLMRRLDQFEAFVALMQPKYEDSPLKLFGFLSVEDELRYLFNA
ncbi:ERF family protein [Borrelia miyamotoi]|uniref:ERF family protein n=1 Tax=Borrelia miyamotoi TaxID=47466 RepID=A0AAQ2WXD8_9SPIR|nr:ERF family protein [Borrelia miyamotoi]WAZ85656.1 ERF family protein [Borrelia miyamotoi]WAZ91439.1 ERF family protein [Borrelia miyamotoi]WAZ92726.1 ERF family protein [Borrelia miyamotoi]WAZ94017.1 ERF family protein [Borrelia miyamotoi]WAZ95308.1 ERF family protein [Borrelia miyamotoi]